MNISQPVDSIIEGVSFGVLSSKDILDLSVKRITFPTSLDARLHPIPGGLHDLALGAFLDNPCATCFSDVSACPGHCGHIELPVKVFHCSFMDQAYRLIRAQCVFCQRLRMRRQEIKIYCCKLRLLRWGLVKEVEELDEIITRWRAKGTEDAQYMSDSDSDVDDRGDENLIIDKMESFVKRAIDEEQQVGGYMRNQAHNEVVGRARKELIRSFLLDICKTRSCRNPNCGGISPSWRKNRYTSVFKKPLSEKERKVNSNKGLQAVNQLVTDRNRQRLIKEKRVARRIARNEAQEALDEGVADLDDSSPHEELDEVDMLATQIDGEIEEEIDYRDEEEDHAIAAPSGSLIQGEASLLRPKRRENLTETEQIFVNASEAHASLKEMFIREREIFGLLYSAAERTEQVRAPSADMFFVDHLLVPPNKYRKESKTGPEEISESPENSSYRTILAICEDLYEIRKNLVAVTIDDSRRLRSYDDFKKSWLLLQDAVNSLFDQDRNPNQGYSGRATAQGIKQKLEKKEGMFRMNIMGKRVNFAARSVISPDPNIETNEIGIPPVFAQKLTYPEPVTQHTFEELKQAVINGPEKYPGAVSVEMENGQIINLRTQSPEERIAIANRLLAPSTSGRRGVNKKVHRHLNNGDIVIMNRQPTLHKPSMMCHRARVLKGEKTIRMHYANCKTYNADFDGDEMNMHFPQNEIARAEALQIADTDHQYISATAGEPLRGLIQDHISISVRLTSRDTFYNRDDYQTLLYAALRPETGQLASEKILTVEPAILRPRELWTGKQIINSVLLNIKPYTHEGIFLNSKSSTKAKNWGAKSEEGEVFFQNGELITGIIDKKQIGPSDGGFVHMVYEAYGHTAAGQLLSILGRLLTKLLNMHAFSCGVEDLILTDSGEKTRGEKLADADHLGQAVASKYVSLNTTTTKNIDAQLTERLEQVFRDEEKQADLDTVMNSQTGQLSTAITESCLPDGLIKPFPKNQMQAMTISGAKGSAVNANLISCNLGQQVLEGRRVPTMISGKTLPSFKPYETNIRAGGYIVDRFLTGVRPQEYYFHAMAGREGLIDTAVKTSRSGYLQRCLVKGLEGLRAEYDSTVRDSDGTMVQTLYGEDGIDIIKKGGVNNLKFIAHNYVSVFASLNVRDDIERLMNAEAQEWNKRALKKLRKTRDLSIVDPALSIFPPGSTGGCTSERFAAAVKKYIDENPDKLIRDKKRGIELGINKKTLERVMNMNYMKSIVEPGEAIGVVAAQSIGEPSTQMTLNTFHLAGHAAKNVTLGIPRLREILMTASLRAKTPTMSLRLLDEMNEDQAQQFAKAISRLPLADVTDRISVTEKILEDNGQPVRQYRVQLDLFPSQEYCEEYAIKVSDVLDTIETKFILLIHNKVQAEFKKRDKEKSMERATINDALPEIGRSARRIRDEAAQAQDEGENSDDDDGGDDDADKAKRQSNMDEGTTYADPDEDEEAIERQGQLEADDAVSDSEDSTYGGTLRERPTDPNSDNEEAKPASLFSKFVIKERETRLKGKFDDVTSFRFNDATGSSCTIVFSYKLSAQKLLFLPIAEYAARNALIQHIPGIGSCTYTIAELRTFDPFSHELHQDKVPTVLTEGVNLSAMSDYQDIINPYTISTNDIGATLRHYGIEACRSAIMNEMRSVFASHSIDVDARHLSLVADYMTRNGGFDAFSRTGMNSKTGVFAKMSFETTVGFLRQAVLEREREDLTGPSARITVGRVGRMGTGAFDVFLPAASTKA